MSRDEDDDKRAEPRYAIGAQVRVMLPGWSAPRLHQASDISVHGIFLEMPEPPAVDTEVLVGPEDVALHGRVVFALAPAEAKAAGRKPGVGVRLDREIDPDGFLLLCTEENAAARSSKSSLSVDEVEAALAAAFGDVDEPEELEEVEDFVALAEEVAATPVIAPTTSAKNDVPAKSVVSAATSATKSPPTAPEPSKKDPPSISAPSPPPMTSTAVDTGATSSTISRLPRPPPSTASLRASTSAAPSTASVVSKPSVLDGIRANAAAGATSSLSLKRIEQLADAAAEKAGKKPKTANPFDDPRAKDDAAEAKSETPAPKPPQESEASTSGRSTQAKPDATPKPPVADAKPSATDAKPSTSAVTDAKPSITDTKPSTSAKPSVTDAKPSVADAKPTVTDAKPSTSAATDAKPSITDTKPSTSAKPSVTHAKPSVTDAKPSATDAKPSTSAKPPVADAKPSAADAKPSTSVKPPVEDAKPSTSAKPPVADAKPSVTDAKPSATDAKPSASAKPPVTDAKPSVADAKPSTSAKPPADAKPSTPSAKPSVTDAKPSTPSAKPSVTDAKPSTPSAKPSVTDAKPSTPSAKPPVADAKSSTPSAKPPVEDTKPSSSTSAAQADEGDEGDEGDVFAPAAPTRAVNKPDVRAGVTKPESATQKTVDAIVDAVAKAADKPKKTTNPFAELDEARAKADAAATAAKAAQPPGPVGAVAAKAAPPQPSAQAPIRSEPIRSEPIRSEPIRSEPIRSEPIRSEPIRSEPIRSEPIRSEPIRSEPIRSEPIRSEPTRVPQTKPAATSNVADARAAARDDVFDISLDEEVRDDDSESLFGSSSASIRPAPAPQSPTAALAAAARSARRVKAATKVDVNDAVIVDGVSGQAAFVQALADIGFKTFIAVHGFEAFVLCLRRRPLLCILPAEDRRLPGLVLIADLRRRAELNVTAFALFDRSAAPNPSAPRVAVFREPPSEAAQARRVIEVALGEQRSAEPRRGVEDARALANEVADLSRRLDELGATSLAISGMRYAGVVAPTVSAHKLSLARLLLWSPDGRDRDEASTIVEAVLRQEPRGPNAHVMRAYAFEARGRRDEAKLALRRALQLQEAHEEANAAMKKLEHGERLVVFRSGKSVPAPSEDANAEKSGRGAQ